MMIFRRLAACSRLRRTSLDTGPSTTTSETVSALEFATSGSRCAHVAPESVRGGPIAAVHDGALPWLGMNSGVQILNPGFSIWPFALMARFTEDPVAMVQWIQWSNVIALWAFFWLFTRAVPTEERGAWLWGLALFAVSPFAIIFSRKLWAQNVLPFFCAVVLWGHFYRRTRLGAFAWGLAGALLGQIHMSGFFFAFALALAVPIVRHVDHRDNQRDPQNHAANQRRGACDGRQRYVMCFFASSVNRSDVDDLFPGRVRKTSPRKTEQAKHYQNDAKRFAHGSPLRQRLHLIARKPTRGRGPPVLRQDLIVST